MASIRIYVTDAEKAEIEALAHTANLSISGLLKSKLNLKSGGQTSNALAIAIERAEALTPGKFFLTDMFPKTEWNSIIAGGASAGQVGKQFYHAVQAGDVKNVRFLKMKDRKAYYEKA
jgi:hypothetical protein